LFGFCERNEFDAANCTGYVSSIEEIHYTGRFKMVLLLATGEDESTGKVARKKFHILREFGDFIDFDKKTNFKIAVHYMKTTSDFIDNMLEHDKYGFQQDYRFYGDIIIAVDDVLRLGQSFVADFSDQYTQFDIGFGIPSTGEFLTNEFLPYNGNKYDNKFVTMEYSNISVGPHSISNNSTYSELSLFDRNTNSMIIHGNSPGNVIANGSFELGNASPGDGLFLEPNLSTITNWVTSKNGVTYYENLDNSSSNQASSGKRFVQLSVSERSISGGTLAIPDSYLVGGIKQTFNTKVGTVYRINFDVGYFRTQIGALRHITADVGSGSQRFEIVQRRSGPSSLIVWEHRTWNFTATSTSTTIEFFNSSNGDDASHAPLLDNIQVVQFSAILDELSSETTADCLLLSETEFSLNYSLGVSDRLSQVPITVSETVQNRNPDLWVDSMDKMHVAWQSNRHGTWDIFYAGARDRSIPFRFETRITDNPGISIEPSLAADSKGRRLIAWQDDRNGEFQIYSAIAKEVDDMWFDQCKVDEAEEYVRGIENPNIPLDPYSPYAIQSDILSCLVTFDFDPPATGAYHFRILFYSDANRTNLVKSINSKTDIAGWRARDLQIPYDGVTLLADEMTTITYGISDEDDLEDTVYYLRIEYETIDFDNSSAVIDINESENIILHNAEPGLLFRQGDLEDRNNLRGIVEFRGASPRDIDVQDVSYFTESGGDGITFPAGVSHLIGVKKGDVVSSSYFKFDPQDSKGIISIKATVRFNEPVVGIFYSTTDLSDTDDDFAVSGVEYLPASSRGLEIGTGDDFDHFTVSDDRKTLTFEAKVDASCCIDAFRVITTPESLQVKGTTDFVFYCPTEQAPRCHVNANYTNDSNFERNVHLRVTFYADAKKELIVFSSFTLLDASGWTVSSGSFPSGGIIVPTAETISAIFDPDFLPFEYTNSQTTESGEESQFLLCGVPYHVVVESYIDSTFEEINSFELTCPCFYADASIWREDKDSTRWACSGQGGDDFRVSATSNKAMRPHVESTENYLFYIAWEDYRYTRIANTQSPISPDYFFGIWNAESNELISSGQGDFDRRVTYFSDEPNQVLNDASIFVDQFQNLNMVFHDGHSAYSRACSVGCPIETFTEIIKPCQFTDGTDGSFFQIGGLPERDIDQYMKIRIVNKYVVFSTYLDLETPVEVVNDCFVELDIIGVPGTYAYRLKNDEDESFTEWLPIGPDVPFQQGDEYGTENERDFFRAYFTGKDRFVAPWVLSPNNGSKRVCCEILTFFGKTTTFCFDCLAIYKELEYNIDFFLDAAMTEAAPEFNHYPVVSTQKTVTPIDDENLVSITEDVIPINTIYVKVTFKNPEKLELLERLRALDRYDHLGDMTISVFQQGLNDQLGLPLTLLNSETFGTGVYGSAFKVAKDDSVVNVDGLAVVTVNVPGDCKPFTIEDAQVQLDKLLTINTLDQEVKVLNNFTIFRDKYNDDDTRNSFGNPSYYKTQRFGSGGVNAGSGDENWVGGGAGPIKGAAGGSDFVTPPGGG